MRFLRGFLGLAAACSDPPPALWNLPDVPIEGGTAEEREAVHAELLEIDRWLGPGRLRLHVVRIEAVAPPYGGKYVGDGVVLLDDDLEGTLEIRTVTRHEVCHALDDAEDQSGPPMGVLDQIAESLETSEAIRDLSASGWRAEAFAQTCEITPFVTHLLATRCPEDDPRIAEIASWLLDRVWTESEPPSEAPLATPVVFQPPESGTIPGHPWNDGSVRATTDPALVQVTLVDDTGFNDVWVVDRETGQVVTDRDVDPEQLPRIDTPISPALWGWAFPYGLEGVAVIEMLRVEVSEIGWADERMLWLDDGGSWAPVRDGCWKGSPGFPRDPFVADDRAWLSWYDGERYLWAPIGARP